MQRRERKSAVGGDEHWQADEHRRDFQYPGDAVARRHAGEHYTRDGDKEQRQGFAAGWVQGSHWRTMAGLLRELMQLLRRVKRILQQRRHRHRSDATGHGRDPTGALLRYVEIHVAHQSALDVAVDADIDDDGPLLDPFAFHQPRLADGNDDDVGARDVLMQIFGEAMTGRHSAACEQQFEGHRPADDVGRADYDRFHAYQVVSSASQQGHDAVRRARAQRVQSHGEASDVVWLLTVDVFVGRNSFDHGFAVDVPG